MGEGIFPNEYMNFIAHKCISRRWLRGISGILHTSMPIRQNQAHIVIISVFKPGRDKSMLLNERGSMSCSLR